MNNHKVRFENCAAILFCAVVFFHFRVGFEKDSVWLLFCHLYLQSSYICIHPQYPHRFHAYIYGPHNHLCSLHTWRI